MRGVSSRVEEQQDFLVMMLVWDEVWNRVMKDVWDRAEGCTHTVVLNRIVNWNLQQVKRSIKLQVEERRLRERGVR